MFPAAQPLETCPLALLQQPPACAHYNPLPEAGMVLSIGTDFEHPEVGPVKIEDTVVVTPAGPEGLGDLGRQWTIVDG
jgi:hypothetical protein